jgi:hypothetical protein
VTRTRAAAALLTLAALLECAGTGCTPADKPQPAPAATTNPAAIRDLCDYFKARTSAQLLTPQAEGDVAVRREAAGIPRPLAEHARLFYDGEALSAPIDKNRAARLDDKRMTVLKTCIAYGWASPQPTA